MRSVQPYGTAPGTAHHNGDPILGSVPDADFFNVHNAELAHLVQYAGLTPSGDDSDLQQVRKAVDAMIAAGIASNAPNLAAYLRYNASAVLEAGYWAKPVVPAVAGDTATPDPAAGNVFTPAAPLSANLTLGFPGGLAGKAGMFLVVLKQDATGGRTLALASGYKLAGGSWSTAANAVNLLWVTSDGSGTTLDVVIAQRGA